MEEFPKIVPTKRQSGHIMVRNNEVTVREHLQSANILTIVTESNQQIEANRVIEFKGAYYVIKSTEETNQMNGMIRIEAEETYKSHNVNHIERLLSGTDVGITGTRLQILERLKPTLWLDVSGYRDYINGLKETDPDLYNKLTTEVVEIKENYITIKELMDKLQEYWGIFYFKKNVNIHNGYGITHMDEIAKRKIDKVYTYYDNNMKITKRTFRPDYMEYYIIDTDNILKEYGEDESRVIYRNSKYDDIVTEYQSVLDSSIMAEGLIEKHYIKLEEGYLANLEEYINVLDKKFEDMSKVRYEYDIDMGTMELGDLAELGDKVVIQEVERGEGHEYIIMSRVVDYVNKTGTMELAPITRTYNRLENELADIIKDTRKPQVKMKEPKKKELLVLGEQTKPTYKFTGWQRENFRVTMSDKRNTTRYYSNSKYGVEVLDNLASKYKAQSFVNDIFLINTDLYGKGTLEDERDGTYRDSSRYANRDMFVGFREEFPKDKWTKVSNKLKEDGYEEIEVELDIAVGNHAFYIKDTDKDLYVVDSNYKKYIEYNGGEIEIPVEVKLNEGTYRGVSQTGFGGEFTTSYGETIIKDTIMYRNIENKFITGAGKVRYREVRRYSTGTTGVALGLSIKLGTGRRKKTFIKDDRGNPQEITYYENANGLVEMDINIKVYGITKEGQKELLINERR